MMSSEDSPSSPVLGTLRRSSRRDSTHSPTLPARKARPRPKVANSSQTLSPPKKPTKTASKVANNGGGQHLREGVPPDDKGPQTCQSLESHSSCLQEELSEHSSISSPRNTSENNFSPQSLSKVLTRSCKKASGPSDLRQRSNILTGTLVDSPAKELESETHQFTTIIETVEVSTKCAKRDLPTDDLAGTLAKVIKTKTKTKSEIPSPRPCTRLSCNLKSSVSHLPSTPRRDRSKLRQPQKLCLSSTPGHGSSKDDPFSITLSPIGSKRVQFPDDSPFSEQKTAQSAEASPCSRTRGRGCRGNNLAAVRKTLTRKKRNQSDDPVPPSPIGSDDPVPLSSIGSKRVEFPDDSPFCEKVVHPNPLKKTAEPDAASSRIRPPGRRKRKTSCRLQCCSSDEHPRTRPGKVLKTEEGPQEKTPNTQPQEKTPNTPPQEKTPNTQHRLSCRPRFQPLPEYEFPDLVRSNPDETTLSSDLSIELSLQEDRLTSFSLDEEEEEEDEELPSFLLQMDKKPLSITEGLHVWCKFRNFPFWPAVVKSVNRKLKKASIVFVDDLLLDTKGIRKGFSVRLRSLKHFDCDEADQLVCKAKEKYEAGINWCLELIGHYRIVVGCGSFTGSFIEYFSDAISCPVRRKYPQNKSALTFPALTIMDCDDEEMQQEEDEEEEEEEHSTKKLLPDRAKAARNRANVKLVHFIVNQRKVDKRLLAVISGQQPSKWLRSFRIGNRSVVDTYLEDEGQLDQLYRYLRTVYNQAPHTAPCLAHVDLIRFVLDVLLPEAIISAIAGVEDVSLEEAEAKYIQGPCLSKRERQEFDLMIEEQERKRTFRQIPNV